MHQPPPGNLAYYVGLPGNRDSRRSATQLHGRDVRSSVINEWYNRKITDTIESGYVWNGLKVWLSMENQMNYKTAYDLALQTGGENLPVTFKLGEEDNPTFYEFASMQQLQEFYTGAVKHIQETQKEGW